MQLAVCQRGKDAIDFAKSRVAFCELRLRRLYCGPFLPENASGNNRLHLRLYLGFGRVLLEPFGYGANPFHGKGEGLV
jgi:hypothetical protein